MLYVLFTKSIGLALSESGLTRARMPSNGFRRKVLEICGPHFVFTHTDGIVERGVWFSVMSVSMYVCLFTLYRPNSPGYFDKAY